MTTLYAAALAILTSLSPVQLVSGPIPLPAPATKANQGINNTDGGVNWNVQLVPGATISVTVDGGVSITNFPSSYPIRGADGGVAVMVETTPLIPHGVHHSVTCVGTASTPVPGDGGVPNRLYITLFSSSMNASGTVTCTGDGQTPTSDRWSPGDELTIGQSDKFPGPSQVNCISNITGTQADGGCVAVHTTEVW